MHIYARQGDLVIEQTDISGELKEHTKLVLAGRDSAPHVILGTVLARQEGRMFFVRVAETTEVTHSERHLPVVLKPGDYIISPLRERGDEADRAVDD
jgi:hypothetical protein